LKIGKTAERNVIFTVIALGGSFMSSRCGNNFPGMLQVQKVDQKIGNVSKNLNLFSDRKNIENWQKTRGKCGFAHFYGTRGVVS
jgi:hypothetical protein